MENTTHIQNKSEETAVLVIENASFTDSVRITNKSTRPIMKSIVSDPAKKLDPNDNPSA